MPKKKSGPFSSNNFGMRNSSRLGKKGLIQEDFMFEEPDNFLSFPVTKSGQKNAPGTPKLD